MTDRDRKFSVARQIYLQQKFPGDLGELAEDRVEKLSIERHSQSHRRWIGAVTALVTTLMIGLFIGVRRPGEEPVRIQAANNQSRPASKTVQSRPSRRVRVTLNQLRSNSRIRLFSTKTSQSQKSDTGLWKSGSVRFASTSRYRARRPFAKRSPSRRLFRIRSSRTTRRS